MLGKLLVPIATEPDGKYYHVFAAITTSIVSVKEVVDILKRHRQMEYGVADPVQIAKEEVFFHKDADHAVGRVELMNSNKKLDC